MKEVFQIITRWGRGTRQSGTTRSAGGTGQGRGSDRPGNHDIRLIAAGRAVSFAGDLAAANALVLHAYDQGRGSSGVAAVMVAAGAPLVLGAPLAGRIVDRSDSRRLTTVAALWQGSCAALLVLLTTVAAQGLPGFLGALLLIGAMGCGQAVSGPAWNALIPCAVPGEQVGKAVATATPWEATPRITASWGPSWRCSCSWGPWPAGRSRPRAAGSAESSPRSSWSPVASSWRAVR